MSRNPSNRSKIKSILKGYPKRWSLHRKILLSMVTLILLLGLTTVVITHSILSNVLRTEFKSKGLSQAKSIAANSVIDVLMQNTSRLKKLVDNEKSSDPNIAYIFIADSSYHIMAHTFNTGFPADLARVNYLGLGKAFNIQTLDTRMGLIFDITVPVFSENSLIGQTHLGIRQNGIQRTINAISLIFIGTTLLIMIAAIFFAYRVSSLITTPISGLVEAIQSIQKGNFSARIDVKTKDEIGLLASAFNEMSSNLNLMIEEIKRLTTLKERNRIALDFHDSCAQDLASIIKRLELCEKLFKIEPAKGYEELTALRNNAGDILNRTRQMIYNLKSPEALRPDLLSNLSAYIEDYEKSNDVIVKLDMPRSLNDISPERTQSIFYIIKEALINIRKHSRARNVELSLESDSNRNLKINIKDDGKGFDIGFAKSSALQSGRWGLEGMKQRATSLGGTLDIDSRPQRGTEIFINIPLLEPESYSI